MSASKERLSSRYEKAVLQRLPTLEGANNCGMASDTCTQDRPGIAESLAAIDGWLIGATLSIVSFGYLRRTRKNRRPRLVGREVDNVRYRIAMMIRYELSAEEITTAYTLH